MANLSLTLGNVLGTIQPGTTASNDIITLSSKPQYSINYVDVDAGLGTDQLKLTGYSTLTSGKFTISTPDSNGWIHIDTISGASSTEFHIRVKNVESVTFYGGTTVQLSYGDSIPPTLSTSNPVDAATGVAVNSNIVLTFSEVVQRGTGLIEIHSDSATGAVVESYDAATSTNLSFSGSTLTINPTADLSNSKTYFVTIASGAVKDTSNNSYSGNTTYDFTTVADTIPPTVTTFSPASAATGVAVNSNIVLTFSEAIQRGTGTIEIHSGSANGTTVATYDVATNTSNLTFSANTLTINPTNDLASDGTHYFVTLASVTVKDLAVSPNLYAGTTTYDFFTIDTTAPTVTTFSPADGSTGVVVGSNIVLTFSETIQKGTGAIEIHSGSATGTTVASYDAATNSSNLTFSGNTLTINPTADLANDGTRYFVTLASGTVKDVAGNSYSGIDTYDFFTVDAVLPTVSVFSPVAGATGVAVGSDIVLTFSETIKKGTGTVEIHADSSTGTLFESYNAATNTSNLTFSSNTLTVNPTSTLATGIRYFVTLAPGSVADSTGNSFAGTTAYDFTTIAAVDNTSPTLSTSNPADAATNVTVNSDVVLTFSEAVQRGSGTIEIHSGSSTGSIVASYDAVNSSNLTFSGNTLTINPAADLSNSTTYYVTIASGAVKDLSNNSYSGITTYDFTTVADTTLPTVTSVSPALAATGVPVGSDIVITFSEAVQVGTGLIEIHSGSATGTTVATYDAANSANLRFAGNTLTINPTADLASDGTHYFVTLASGTVKDLAVIPNLYAGPTTYDFFTVDTTAPTVTSFSPTDAQTGVAVGSNIVLTFSEAIKKGAGAIEIHSGSATGTTVATFEAATNTSNLTFSDKTLTINPTADLANDGTHYFITLAPGTVYDLAGNLYAGTTIYDFFTLDTTPPTVTAFSPVYAATGVAIGSDIVLTFSETIQRGTGAIEIHAGSATGTLLEPAYDAAINSSNLTFSGNTLTINPTNSLATDTHYFVTFTAGSVKDSAGNSYTGITNYGFTTVDTIAPTVTSFSPTDAATGVVVGSDIVLTFSEAVHNGTGLIEIHSGSETGAVVASYDAATNTSNLTFSGNTLTINPTDNLTADTHFFVTLQNGAVNDLAGNHYAGTTAYDFTTGADPYAGSVSNIGVDAGPVVVGVGGLGVLAWVLFL